MSHNPQETIICPNCGYHATYNYCAECGQETHLHKDTFFGLIGHFVSHYFHYDSKFWKTMKLLWFHPGALTIAYWKKQRNRFIPPISLYIFISAVFFLLVSFFSSSSDIASTPKDIQKYKADSIKLERRLAAKRSQNPNAPFHAAANSFADAGRMLQSIDDGKDEKEGEELADKLMHTIPKVFFFMIPLMAFILKLLFFRRKDIYFVDHAVFSLHYHSFWFSAMLLTFIDPIPAISYGLAITSGSIALIYFIFALKNAYRMNWLKSILYAFIISLVYIFVLFAGIAGITLYIFRSIHHASV